MIRTYLQLGMALLVFTLCAQWMVAAEPAKLLMKNARIFTMASGQEKPFVGYLLVGEDGRIVAIGEGEPPSEVNAHEIFDAHGEWVIPGFLSAHSHLWQSAFRGLAAEKTLLGWIDELYGERASKAKAEDFYWFTLHGAIDHLRHGVTGAYDFTYGGSKSQCNGIECDEAAFKGEMESGIRFIHGYQPDTISATDTAAMARVRLKLFLDWVQSQPKSDRLLSVMLNGSTAFNNTYEQAIAETGEMNEFHLGNQSHYLEPPNAIGEEQAKFRWFMESGMMRPSLYFGHFIHTNDFILDEVARVHGGMSWNPLSNGRLASGVADIPKYLKKGIRVGMGEDGEASADLADPFENMRSGLYAIRDKYEDATVMSPYQVMYLHTMGSADVMGVADKLGSLEVGKYADFLVIDPKNYGTVFDPYASLVLVTSQEDLARVYVGGELKVEKGVVLNQPLEKIQTEVEKRSAATLAQ